MPIRLPGPLAPLADRPFAALLGAIVLVELGAHIGNFALVWLAVELIGDRAAYLQSLQFAAVILGAALGGHLLDARDPRAVLLGAWAVRALAALCPLIAAWVLGSPLLGLGAAAIALALAQAQSEPATQASLTAIAGTPARRQAANALLFASLRVTRLIGRGAPGVLILAIPVLHLFSLNAVLILAALALMLALPHFPAPMAGGAAPAAMRGALAGARFMLADRELRVFLVSTAAGFVSWVIAISLGPALIVHGRALTWLGIPPAGGYSLLLTAYGIGNLLGTGISGRSPGTVSVFTGHAIFGLAASGIGLAGGLASQDWAMPLMLAAIFIAGLGAVGHDLRLSNILQAAGPPQVVSALARARMIVGWGSMCASTVVAPALFAAVGVATTVVIAGLLTALVSVWALRRLR